MTTIVEQLQEAADKATQASEQADAWAKGPVGTTVPTDSGPVPTIAEFARAAQARADASIEAIGWVLAGDFTAGCTVTDRNQYVLVVGGPGYRWDGALPKVAAPGSSPTPIATGSWVLVGDATLRGDLAAASGAGRVGGVARPGADQGFAGGATPSTVDNFAALNAIFAQEREVRLAEGDFDTSAGVVSTGTGNLSVHGAPGATKLIGTSNGDLITVSGKNSVSISDLTLDVSLAGAAGDDHALIMVDQSDAKITRVAVEGLRDTGTGIICYSQSNTQFSGVRVAESIVEGQRALSSNTNGVLLSSAKLCEIISSSVSGIASFGVELKNNSQWNITSASRAYDSLAGLYYGSDAPGVYPSANLAFGFLAADCDYGYQAGFGDNNLLVGMLADMRGAASSIPEGVRVDGDKGSAFAVHVAGDGYGVRYQGGASNNYTQLSYQPDTSAAKHVVLAVGAARNATEITHPGLDLKTITNNLLDNSGQTLSGQNSNPAWCHAVGEYIGVMSDGWRWVHGYSGATRLSSHKWRFEGTGESLLSVSNDGSGLAGFNVNNPTGNRNLTWSESGTYWQIDGGSYGMRFYSSTLRPNSDNLMDFGTAAFRGKIGWFAQGVQTTSDARYKSDVRQMTEAELAAGAAIAKSIGFFSWLSEDSDRLHAGTTVQTVIQCMNDAGLNAFDYGFVCYDQWADEYEEVFEAVLSETGETEMVATGEKVLVREAGDLYTFRDHELYKFLIRAHEHRLSSIESRLTALEAKL